MVIGSLHKTSINRNYRVLFVTPYENQVRLIFMRLKELIDVSPLLKKNLVKMTMSPYLIQWKNGSTIMGFTTGAASGSGAASVRGQKADYIYMDKSLSLYIVICTENLINSENVFFKKIILIK